MISIRSLIVLSVCSLAAAVPILEERADTKTGSMMLSYFGQQTGCPNISEFTKSHLQTKSYVGVYHASRPEVNQCGKWMTIKYDNQKAIHAKIIDSTDVNNDNILGGKRVFERLGLEPAGKVDGIQWAFCNSYNKADCPDDL